MADATTPSTPIRLRVARRLTALALLVVAVWGCSPDRPADSAASVDPAPGATHAGTIVAVGDSLTAGLGVAQEEAYPAQLARRLQVDGYPYRVVNAGVSGETSSGLLSRMEWVVASLQPDIVILATGANDGLRGLDPALLEANLDRLVGLLSDRGIQVVLAGMRMLPNLGPDYTRAFAEIYPRIAKKHRTLFIPFLLDGVAGQARFNQPDRLHPTAQGYARVVETIYPAVREAIARHQAARQPS